MKTKNKLIVIIIFGFILIFVGIIFIIFNKNDNNSKSDSNNKDNNSVTLVSYICSKELKNNFNLENENNSEYGSYTQISEYEFTISDNKIKNHEYRIIYKFDNRKGFDKLYFDGDKYEEKIDEKTLTKTYTSKNFMLGTLMDDDSIKSYLTSIENDGFKCKKVGE